MNIEKFLGSKAHIQLNKELTKHLGLRKAYLLGYLIDARKYFRQESKLNSEDDSEWFYIVSSHITERSGMSYKIQLKLFNELEVVGLITSKIMGIPSKKYFQINDKDLFDFIVNSSSKK